jgi:hypothetical protein
MNEKMTSPAGISIFTPPDDNKKTKNGKVSVEAMDEIKE